MSYGYGGRPNPFDQRDGGSNGGGYGAPPARGPPQASFGQGPRPGGGGGGGGPAPRYNQGPAPARRNDYGSNNVEMASLTQNASSFSASDPNAILNECRSIDKGVDTIEQNLNQLRMLQDRSLNEADSSGSSTSRQLDSLATETMSMYRELTERVRQVKSQREAQQPKNAPQVGRVDRRLKQAIQSFQQVESTFRKKTQDQMARQYRIVRPDASESEVRAVVEDTQGGSQVFQQAMMQSDRRGQARAVLNAVQDRKAALEKIEQQMIELAQLFQDMDTLVVQQEVQVTQIEQKGEEVVENLDKGNEEIGTAVVTARKTRKKKWICLGICVAIVVVIAVAVTVYVVINQQANKAGKKRDIQSRDVLFAGEAPVAAIYAQSKIVNKGSELDSGAPLSRFVGGRTKRYVIVDQEFDPEADNGQARRGLPGGVFHEGADTTDLDKRYVIINAEDDDTPLDKRYVIVDAEDDDNSVDKRMVRVGVAYTPISDKPTLTNER